ncbi:MAG: hypothetical protein L0Y72_08305 [Gemmataceae bacterium]|nr:hypothetical protein [Gemmataceae bacterium]MCI0739031.1 hypothetical protein [Gemmataceae bacterium]
MNPLSSRAFWLLCAVFVCGGCVERRFVITTEPPGAIVYNEAGNPIGGAPTDKPFTYYGKYRFTLVKDGAETMVVEENVKAPWYQWIGLDFVSENLIPWTFRDIRRFHYQLQPKQLVPPQAVLQEAQNLRGRGQTIGIPLADPGASPSGPLMLPIP